MTVNRRVLQRLHDELARFELGEASLPEIQAAILAHGHAVELGQQWHDLVNHVEGAIDAARFSVEDAGLAATIRQHLERLRVAARRAMDAEPADSE